MFSGYMYTMVRALVSLLHELQANLAHPGFIWAPADDVLVVLVNEKLKYFGGKARERDKARFVE